MRPSELLSPSITELLRLPFVRARYRGRSIYSARIAPDVRLGPACRIGVGVQLGPGVEIGGHSYVNDGTVVGSGRIGRFCSIGYYVNVGLHEHPLDFISTSPSTYGLTGLFPGTAIWSDFARPPTVEHDVWIGSHVTVLQGVRVATGAVIAAGAVVTKDVEPYAIVGGVPARVIRRRFPEDVIARLLATTWWEWTDEELLRCREVFTAGSRWTERLTALEHVARGRRRG